MFQFLSALAAKLASIFSGCSESLSALFDLKNNARLISLCMGIRLLFYVVWYKNLLAYNFVKCDGSYAFKMHWHL